MSSFRLPVALLLLTLALTWPTQTDAQIRRCTAPDGTSVFTDRSCEEMNSVARRPDTGDTSSSLPGAYRPRCMRSVDDLMFEMTLAFDSQDTNRLAGLYHWTGMSSGAAYATVERLDRMVQRPLVGIVPILPAPSEDEAAASPAGDTPSPAAPGIPRWQTWTRPVADASATEADMPAANTAGEPAPRPPTRPVALRVEQTGTDGANATHTVFGLTRHFGCWWVSG